MQLDIRGSYAHVAAMPARHIEGRLHLDLSGFGPREAAWDLDSPRLDPDRRKLEIKSWVQLHHLKLMTACGRSLARSIAKSKATGTSQALAHSRGPQALERMGVGQLQHAVPVGSGRALWIPGADFVSG